MSRETLLPTADEKKCRRCLDWHPRTHFPYGKRLCRRCHRSSYRRRRWLADREANCAIHREKRARSARKRGPGVDVRKRNSNLKVRYGITAVEYDAMLLAQGGCCAVCKRPPRDKRPLVVDHKHGTTPVLVRGALCQLCNTTLGYARESIEVLKAMIRYIERGERELRKRGKAGG